MKTIFIFLVVSIIACGQTTVSTITCSSISEVSITNVVVKEADVIVLAGQSNALGYPTEFGALPEYLQGTQTWARTWNKTYSTWSDQGLHPATPVYWGVELTGLDFIHSRYGRPLFLVKVAYGSTSLANRGTGTDWQKGDLRYNQLTNYIDIARSKLESEGYTAHLRDFWWIQGEDDTLSNEWAVAYSSNFNQFISDLSGDGIVFEHISIASLPPQYEGNFASAVKTNQIYLAETREDTDLISTDNLPWDDGVHYSAQSYMTLGERFAEKYISMYEATPFPYAITNGVFFEEF